MEGEHANKDEGARYGLPPSIYDTYVWQIHQRVAHDPDFRSMCEEYEAAVRALEHFRSSEASHPRITEYAELVEELLQEILQELKQGRKA